MSKLRGVFALISGFDPQSVLLVQGKDRKFRLPGGEALIPRKPDEPLESDACTLKRTVEIMCGLHVRMVRKIGPDHANDGGCMVAGYECAVAGGQLLKTPFTTVEDDEVHCLRFFTRAEIAAGVYDAPCRHNGGTEKAPLKLVGPRTTRMVWDFLSCRDDGSPVPSGDDGVVAVLCSLLPENAVTACHNLLFLRQGGKTVYWPRL